MARTWEEQINLLNGADAHYTNKAIMASTASWNDKKWMMEILTSDNREKAYSEADTAVREILMDCIEEGNKNLGNGQTVSYKAYNKAVYEMQERLAVTERSLFHEGEGYFQSRVDFYTTGFGDAAIQMGINVCASGTITPDQALAYAQLFRVASDLARTFKYNGYHIEYK